MDSAPSLTTFPSDLLRLILGLLPGYAGPLREVCQQWRTIVANLRLGSMSLSDLSRRGHADLLAWARDLWPEGYPQEVAGKIMANAALGGFTVCMELAGGWGATNYNEAAGEAALGGHEACMELAKGWGATNYDRAMASAAKGGHADCMNLAKGWGATDYDWAMIHAAEGGYEACMNLAKDWGATGYDQAMAFAAEGGHMACIELAKDWGAAD